MKEVTKNKTFFWFLIKRKIDRSLKVSRYRSNVPGSSVGIVTGYGLEVPGSKPVCNEQARNKVVGAC